MNTAIHGYELPNTAAPAIEAPRLQTLSEAVAPERVTIKCQGGISCDETLTYSFSDDEDEKAELEYVRFQSGWDWTPLGLACPKHCVY